GLAPRAEATSPASGRGDLSAGWGDIMKPLLPSPARARSASRGDLSRKRERGPFCPVGDIIKPLLPSPAWARSASRGDLSRKRERGPFCPVGDIMKPLLPSPASGRGDLSGGRGLLQELFAEAA